MPRIPYDSLTVRAVTDELRRALMGGVVQHVAQPAPTDLVLTIHARGANRMLLLSCDANWARAHLTTARRPNPPAPPAFCMLCRKYLEGARVAEVAQRGFDRILDLTLDAPDGREYRLVAELMGKHSNLILTTMDGTILDAAKHITHRVSRHRETLPGRRYLPPPGQGEKTDPMLANDDEVAAFACALTADHEAQVARWMGHFEGVSPFLAEELARRSAAVGAVEAWRDLLGAAREGRWEPVVVRNARGDAVGAYPFPTVQVEAALQHARDSINTALDHYYGTALPRAALDAARHELETNIARALKAREHRRTSLLRSLEEAGRAEEYREAGELLLANLHAIEPGMASVTVPNYYSAAGGERVIALDPTKSPRENADACFRRYRKAKDGVEVQRAQLARAEEDIAALHRARGEAAEAKDLEAVRAAREELSRAGLLRGEPAASGVPEAKRERDFGGKKIRALTTPEGWEILIGENSEANDYLTGKVAGPNDWWLHVRAAASAHVVIRTRNDPNAVPSSVIQRAALLAAQHSPSKHAGLVPVDYTLKKYVRRPKGSASGAALYQNERTVYVNPKA